MSLFSSILSAQTIAHLAEGNVSQTVALSLSVQDVFHVGTMIIIVSLPLTLLLRKPKAVATT
ncbi:hypothetical protein [Paenibacillus sp. LHD-38]|uniref:hypothetical protein n=1 Tax=Paenibacillus sp. LHD-38 TaxID=3072143 RepID=UPI00280C584B|nr:hypothetical protein [Paenibacillus sp. LHD-38]MDQ8734986.1 hypothetical protein [Paenibacillus sp. LHD-38]